jgi:adenylate cyclase class 1
MAQLETALYAFDDRLLCHKYRAKILTGKPGEPFPETTLFTAGMVFDGYTRMGQDRRLAFLKECLYLKCDMGSDRADRAIRKRMADPFFQSEYALPRARIAELAAYDRWNADRQMDFGESLFQHLQQIFTHITDAGDEITGRGAHRDLTILGRKISAFFKKKKNKIAIIRRPNGRLNIDLFYLGLENGVWELYTGDDREHALMSSPNVVRIIAFLVWNDFFSRDGIRMLPNISDTTIQEVRNLGVAIRDLVGTYKTLDIGIEDYLKKARVSRVLAVSGFQKSPWEEVDEDYSVVYINGWGELFVEQFKAAEDLQSFLKASRSGNSNVVVHSYLRRSSSAYEKTIARSKYLMFPPSDIDI